MTRIIVRKCQKCGQLVTAIQSITGLGTDATTEKCGCKRATKKEN